MTKRVRGRKWMGRGKSVDERGGVKDGRIRRRMWWWQGETGGDE
jgi:hypothetical protein